MMIADSNQIAVVILNYLDTDATIKCVNSVRKALQSKIFLVDNSANQDERCRLTSLYQEQKEIYMFFPSENLGFAAGVNLAIKEAVKKGFKRFLLLNNDAILLDGVQVQLMDAYERWPTSLIAPTIRWSKHINKGYYYHKYLGFIIQNRIFKQNSWLFFLSGCALAFDKSFLERVGLLNEIFFMYGEDVELCHRAHEKRIPIVLLEDELVYHSGSHSSKMASFFYEYHMLRSHYLLCFLLFKNPLKKLMAIIGKTVILAIRSCFRSIKYRTIAPLTALLIAPLSLKIRPDRKLSNQSNSK